jgi:hypothetical protein
VTRNRLAIGALVAIAAAVIVASALVLARGVPSDVSTSQFAAIGTILGGGGFLFAIVATVVAVMAYANSLPKPDLYVETVQQVAQTFPPSGTWGLKITLGNRGTVAARFVAVRVTFFDWGWQFTDAATRARTPWRVDYSTNPFFDRATWEGGADAVLHPTWPYIVPELGPLRSNFSFGSFSVPSDAGEMIPVPVPKSIDFAIEIVADRMVARSSDHQFVISS